MSEQKPYAYAYVREDGVGQLCWIKKDNHLFIKSLEKWKEVPLYTDEALVNQISDSITLSATAGQFKKWQGLTDDEIAYIVNDTDTLFELEDFARAIEQALKEKNEDDHSR